MTQRVTLILLAAGALVAAGIPAAAGAAPAPAAPRAGQPDHEIVDVLAHLSGAYDAPATDDSPRLTWRSAPVRIDGLPGALYFEVARAESPASPYRQGIMQAFRRQGELRLRVFDLIGEPGLKGALVGLWAAPEAFPRLPLADLEPNLDLVLTPEGDGWRGRTPHPYPTIDGGAVEMTAELVLAPGRIQTADRGYDAAGEQVWGPVPARAVTFTEAEPGVAVTRTPSGLTIIDLVPPDPDLPALASGGNIAVHYTGWLTTGYQFENSRADGRPPLRARIPGTGVAGIDEGLLGMTPGTRRRLIIPPALAFGEEGSIRGRIPPGATLIYDLEALEVQNPAQAIPGQVPHPPTPPRGED